MNENIVTNILAVVKTSTDKEVVFKALVKLRTDLVKDRDGIVLFRECGGIPPVVRLLNKPHEKILEVALSILGNCCTDSQCCTQALENKVLPPLLTILKSVPNTVVLCRACRLLGNLAKDNSAQLMGHSAALSQALCLILEESEVLTTTVMAVRAAKFLLPEKHFLKCFVVHHGFKILLTIFVKLVKNPNKEQEDESGPDRPAGRKSCQPREEYFREVARHLEGVRSDIFDKTMEMERTRSSNEYVVPADKAAMDLVGEIFRCFQIISAAHFYGLIMEVHSTEQGIAGIVFFADEKNPLRSMALKIISNFAKNPLSVAVIAAANAVSAACDLITAENLSTPLTESETRHCINIICSLAEDACNRSKIRRSGALIKLLEKAKMTKSCTETALILYAFNHFQYDQMSMHVLLQEGLVGILIKELDAYLNSSDKQRQEKVQEKKRITRKRKLKQTPPTSFKVGSLGSVITEGGAFLQQPKAWADLFEPDSPGSPKAIMSPSSPCSSRSMSPVSTCSKNLYDVECEAENYSPVCSGDEDESGDEHKAQEEDSDVMKLLAVASQSESNSDDAMLDKEEDDDGYQDQANFRAPGGNTNAIDIIDNLLLRVSLLGENHGELGQPQTLRTIIQAINTFGTQGNTFGSTLTNILSEIQFFVPIVKQDVVHRLHLMTKVDDLQTAATTFLERLTCVAESGYGRGELARLLTRCSHNVQKRAAIAVSFIIRTPKFLHRLLTENGALYILINMMLDKNEEFSQEAADGITALSIALGIEKSNWNQDICGEEFDESTEFPVSYEEDKNGVDVKFVLHRGCSKIPIKFNRKLLTDNSEVFNSMLNGSFKEGNEGEIHLSNYSVHGIKYFLHCIKLMSQKKRLSYPPVYHFDSLLESYELSRIYIMNDLEQILFEMIVSRLSPKACLKVFEWCLKNLNQDLSELAINYYLCGPVKADVRVSMFREADYSPVSKEWNQMIIDTILVRCQNRMCDQPPLSLVGL